MNKINEFYDAKKMFIEQSYSADKISKQLNISRRMIYYWIKKYNWIAIREKFRKDEQEKMKRFSSDMEDFVFIIIEKIKKDISAGNPIAQNGSYLITNLLKNTPMMKRYEDEVKAEKKS